MFSQEILIDNLVNRQDAKNAKLPVFEFIKSSWRLWRLGGWMDYPGRPPG